MPEEVAILLTKLERWLLFDLALGGKRLATLDV
jgi:hypothetical protein